MSPTRETDVRERLVEALAADLIGPFVPDSHPQGGQEVLPIAPSRWYLAGFLAPRGGRAPDADDHDSTDDALAAGSELRDVYLAGQWLGLIETGLVAEFRT